MLLVQEVSWALEDSIRFIIGLRLHVYVSLHSCIVKTQWLAIAGWTKICKKASSHRSSLKSAQTARSFTTDNNSSIKHGLSICNWSINWRVSSSTNSGSWSLSRSRKGSSVGSSRLTASKLWPTFLKHFLIASDLTWLQAWATHLIAWRTVID